MDPGQICCHTAWVNRGVSLMQDSKAPLIYHLEAVAAGGASCLSWPALLAWDFHMDPSSWVVCGWGAMPAHQVVSAAELVVTGKWRSRFLKSFNSVYSCVTPPVEAVLIVITVIQLHYLQAPLWYRYWYEARFSWSIYCREIVWTKLHFYWSLDRRIAE